MLCKDHNSALDAPRRTPNAARAAHSQRGFAVLLVMFILLLGVASIGLTYNRPRGGNDLTDDRTAERLAEVKAALLGYATRQGVFQCSNPLDSAACVAQLNASSKLGELPCPDVTNDGVAEASCATTRIGRVPWRTLGIPEPKDGAGETLWYAVSLRFLNNASNPMVKDGNGRVKSGAINSSTPGDLTVRSSDGSNQTTTAVAVIFSAGAPTAGQSRSPTALAYCSAAQPTLLESLCPSKYLESAGTSSNSVTGGPFIMGSSSNGVNDRLLYVSAADLMPLLEMRLGSELRRLLVQYKWNSECLCYPWGDSWNYSGGIADVGVNRGRFPSTAEPEDWGTGLIARFPAWLKDNDWHNQVYYSSSKRESDPAAICLYCSTNVNLTVKRTPAVNSPTVLAGALVLTAGTPRAGVVRPYLPSEAVKVTDSMTAAMNVFPSYFQDALNDKGTCPGNLQEHASSQSGVSPQVANVACDTVVQPQSRAYDRDRLFFIDAETPATMCPLAGSALVAQVPCKDFSTDKIRDVCTNLVAKLQQCKPGCAAAATEMIVVPCRNNTSSSQCPPARDALFACSAS